MLCSRCVIVVAIPCSTPPGEPPRVTIESLLADVQYPTPWLPAGLIAAVVVGAAVWPADRFTRVVVGLCLVALVIIGYILLPQLLDVDRLM
jgi:hypothetical protein